MSLFLNIFTLRSVLFVFTLHVAKAKRLKDENKNEQMNRFVNNFMAKLSEEEKKLSFLTNQARALRAYSEGSMQRESKYKCIGCHLLMHIYPMNKCCLVFPCLISVQKCCFFLFLDDQIHSMLLKNEMQY